MQLRVIQAGGFNLGVNSSVQMEHSVGGGAVVTNSYGVSSSGVSRLSFWEREDDDVRK